jgi:hypothetical protein
MYVERAPDTGTRPNYVKYIKTNLPRGQRVGRVHCSVLSRTPEDIEGKFWKRPTHFCRAIFGSNTPPPKLSQHLHHLSLSLSVLFLTDTDCMVKLTREREKPKRRQQKSVGLFPWILFTLYNQSSGCKFPHQLCFSSVLCCTVFYCMCLVQYKTAVLYLPQPQCTQCTVLFITALRCCALQYCTALHCTFMYCSVTSCTVF